MSQSWPGPGPVIVRRVADEPALRQSVMVAYALMLSACVVGVTAPVAVILAYIRRAESVGTVWHSHFRNVITVFWSLVAAVVVGLATFPLALGAYLSGGFGWPIVPALAIPLLVWAIGVPVLALWFLYRMVRGVIHASDGRPY